MTFHQGDYSRVKTIPDKASVARRLYRRALDIYPDPRATLGLAMLEQQSGETDVAERRLEEGVRHFPGNVPLALCLGIHFMNQKRFEKAMEILGRFPENAQIRPYLAECRRVMSRESRGKISE